MKKSTGFTLIELLIVMAILAMLAALIGPQLFGALGEGERSTAQTQISNFETALDTYRLDVGRYPDDLQGLLTNDSDSSRWAGPYLRSDSIPLDPWDNEYQYEVTTNGRSFNLLSYGPDGAPGGEGDDADIGRD